MSATAKQPNAFQRWLHAIPSSDVGSRLFAQILPPVDRGLMRLSGNKVSLAALIAGVPVVLLTTTGAKSGEPRTVPLVSVPDGGKWILIASNWGGEKAPAWSFNLRKNPACTITCDGVTGSFVAREISGEEYERYWHQAVALYSGYAVYKKRAAHRHIPVFVLDPA